MGEGSAAFLLKRLADAERDGDQIYAVIRGVGGSSDGKGKGITAPNPVGQLFAIQRAWENAGLDPATATLVEAHGTSTKVGDVVEVESLAKVFGGAARAAASRLARPRAISAISRPARAQPGCSRHALALYNKVLPPTLNCERPNPNIDFAQHARSTSTTTRESGQSPAAHPRRAGVSAYGFGGTNFHLVLEEHVPGMLTQQSQALTPGVVNSATRDQASYGDNGHRQRRTSSQLAGHPNAPPSAASSRLAQPRRWH